MPESIACAATRINQPTENREEPRRAMNLIDDDELRMLHGQKLLWVGEPSLVGRGFEVDRRVTSVVGDAARKCRLADLPWSEQHHARGGAEALRDQSLHAPLDHRGTVNTVKQT
jgi:hypothetical protein